MVGVSFVRQLWEPEGLPQPLQRGRVITNDEIYMGYANVGGCRSAGPTRTRSRRRNRPDRRPVRVPARAARPKSAPAPRQILSRIARLAYRRPVTQPMSQTLLSSTRTAAATAEALKRACSLRSSGCSSTRISCCASTATLNHRQPRRQLSAFSAA